MGAENASGIPKDPDIPDRTMKTNPFKHSDVVKNNICASKDRQSVHTHRSMNDIYDG